MTTQIAIKSFALADVTVSPLSTDVAGAAATYGTSIHLPGAKNLKISGTYDVKELKANYTVYDLFSILKDVTWELDVVKFDPNIFALVTGAVNTAGTGTDYNWSLGGPANAAWFNIEGISLVSEVNGSNNSITLNKCKITELPSIGFTEEDFQPFTLKGRAVKPVGTTGWIDGGYHSTAITLS